MNDQETNRQGILYALATYLMWGIMPIYFRQLQAVPAFQIVLHRVIWSFVLLVAVLLISKGMPAFLQSFRSRRVVLVYSFASFILAINWLTYIWAVNSGHILDSSLGYFINPLVSVALSVLVLKERLRPWQWIAIGIATIGVLYLTFLYGQVPWIALTLASTFGLYGLLKKLSPLGALQGLAMETAMLVIPALALLFWIQSTGEGVLGKLSGLETFLLLLIGLMTAAPLLTFASAARRIPLSTMGLLQYISPTMQLLLGVLLYGEAMSGQRLIGFIFVWSALVIFWIESRLYIRSRSLHPTQ